MKKQRILISNFFQSKKKSPINREDFIFKMKMKLIFLILFFLNEKVFSLSKGRLYGIDKSSSIASFVYIENNSRKYDRLINIGKGTFPGPATATKSIDNQYYIITYTIFDSFAVPHYYILTIDVKNKTKIESNLTLNGPGIGSFWQIGDDEKEIVGIRESFHSGASLELASINKTNGYIKTIGLYPYGSYSLIMTFARQRRLFYNIMNSNLFCGINIDNGNLDIQINVPNEYSIYAIVYDEIKDQLLSIVYSAIIEKDSWFIAKIIIENNSTKIKFERIGKSIIPMKGKYSWSTTYTLALKERQWITLWNDSDDENNNIIFIFDIDNGNIIQNQTINHSKYLNNLVYFDSK
jgi:hypothetical protein